MSLVTYLKPAAFMVFPSLGGFCIGALTKGTVNSRSVAKKLKRPFWTPPGWVFGPMWTGLYTSMGYASYLIYKETGWQSRPMYLFGAQLALNWIWSPIYNRFYFGLAFADILGICGFVAACVKEFWPVNKTASRLMMPYLAWVSLASTINLYVWLNNDPEKLRNE